MEYISDAWYWTIFASIVGLIAGVLALFISVLNHRRVGAMKSLDLRLDVGRTKNKIKVALKKVQLLHGSANNSHRTLASFIGSTQSSMMELWKSRWTINAASIEKWSKRPVKSVVGLLLIVSDIRPVYAATGTISKLAKRTDYG